jgi:hypothetical protein
MNNFILKLEWLTSLEARSPSAGSQVNYISSASHLGGGGAPLVCRRHK